MNFDIRVPIGLLFGLLGLVLMLYGLATFGSSIYEKSLGFNINFIWGGVMILFSILITLPILIKKLKRR